MTVRNAKSPLIELIQYITPDGITVDLHDPMAGRAVLTYEGDGLPPLSYDTTRGPYQNGSTVLGAREPEREIDMVVRWTACNRDDYWDLRSEFVNYLRPNRTDLNDPDPGVLRRVLSNGNIRDLDVFLISGPTWVYPAQWDHFSFQEPLKFIANDPILYDPTPVTCTLTDFEYVGDPDIVFPFEFPFVFVDDNPTVTKTCNLTYEGNWESLPIITVEGPWTYLLIEHAETGKLIELEGYVSPAAEITTIDLTYNVKTIITDSGDSLIAYLTNNSTLGTFAILPDPLVAGGANTINVEIGGGSAATEFILTYYDRYIGI